MDIQSMCIFNFHVMVLWKGLFLCLVLELVLASEDDCHCYIPDQNKFCHADIVIEGTVRTVIGEREKYELKGVRILRVSTDFQQIENIKIFVTPTDIDCEIPKLQKRHKYILSGKVSGTDVIASSCSLILDVAEVSQEMIWKYRDPENGFAANCDCKVQTCQYMDAEQCVYTSSKACAVAYFEYQCYNKHSICEYKDGSCQWKDSEKTESLCAMRYPMRF